MRTNWGEQIDFYQEKTLKQMAWLLRNCLVDERMKKKWPESG
jgi:hypothetical protein